MRFLIVVLLLFIENVAGFAQQDSAVTNNAPGKKPWLLTLGTDFKVKSLKGNYSYYYQGEYMERNNSEVKWVEKSSKITDLLEYGSMFDLKMDVLLSRNRNTKFGLSYNFGTVIYEVDSFFTDGSGNRYPTIYQRNFYFLAITGLLEQSWYFRKTQSELGDPFLFGSLAAGFYRGSQENSGPGSEYFTEGRIGLGYHFKNNWMLKIYGAQNFMFYSERLQSPIFDRRQTLNVNMNLSYAGIGFCKQFSLIPD